MTRGPAEWYKHCPTCNEGNWPYTYEEFKIIYILGWVCFYRCENCGNRYHGYYGIFNSDIPLLKRIKRLVLHRILFYYGPYTPNPKYTKVNCLKCGELTPPLLHKEYSVPFIRGSLGSIRYYYCDNCKTSFVIRYRYGISDKYMYSKIVNPTQHLY